MINLRLNPEMPIDSKEETAGYEFDPTEVTHLQDTDAIFPAKQQNSSRATQALAYTARKWGC